MSGNISLYIVVLAVIPKTTFMYPRYGESPDRTAQSPQGRPSPIPSFSSECVYCVAGVCGEDFNSKVLVL
ncbi:hypothetical protein SK128_017638 [Halocaridina rubra]|uniref:Uncharacterized protein n=1 Tax=Halocaridina rubra TaxID=373956 RepID=A0AAN8XBR7_HALRR